MTSARIIEIFKGIGKIIKLSDLGVADASGVKAQMVATVQQFGAQAGGADYWDDYTQVVGPLQERMKPTVAALDRIPAVAKASVEAYLRTIAPELNQSASASTTAILDALKAQMVAAGRTIAPSGNQFYNYFRNNFGYAALPTSGTPNIPDSWITISIV
jgi:hypothetical protein